MASKPVSVDAVDSGQGVYAEWLDTWNGEIDRVIGEDRTLLDAMLSSMRYHYESKFVQIRERTIRRAMEAVNNRPWWQRLLKVRPIMSDEV